LLGEATALVQTRIARLTDAAPLLQFLVDPPLTYPAELVPTKHERAATIGLLQAVREIFSSGAVGPEAEPSLRQLAERQGWNARDLFMTVRVAVTGRTVTPPLLESCALLGQGECLRRLDRALAWLGEQ